MFAWGAEGRHGPLLAELAEWQEDLWRVPTGSQVVLVKVPSGWGRTTVLNRFEAGITGLEGVPVTLTIRIDGADLPDDAASQARGLRARLAEMLRPPKTAERGRRLSAVELLGLDELGGRAQLGLGVASLFFSGFGILVSFLATGVAAGAAQKAWDTSPAGQDGELARAARAVAAVSVDVPVVVIIDDADRLDVGPVITLVDNLTARCDSQVLVVAAADPSSGLARALVTQLRQGITSGLVYAAEADPDMGYISRLELVRQLLPSLPDAGARGIAQRTATFAEVFTVTAAPRLADLDPGEDDEIRAVIDAAVSTRLAHPAPSAEAAVIAWAGGLLHARQVDEALVILGARRADDDPDVRRWGELARLAGPITTRLTEQVTAGLAAGHRRAVATTLLDQALSIAQDPGADLVAKTAALRAAHRVRGDLPAPGQLPRAQTRLVADLEALGDYAAALQVASEALTGWSAHDPGFRADRDALAAAVIRLFHTTTDASPGLLAEQLIAEAAEGGAATGLEARIWAAIVLLDTPVQRERALALAERAAADLASRSDLGPSGNRWRLLLAYHVGRAGVPDLASRLLAPLITSADPGLQKQARMVQRAANGPRADILLQNTLLEAELATLPSDADDDRLRIHHVLAVNHATLGDYRQALAHSQHELDLRAHIQGPYHPNTLTTRAYIAGLTELCGRPDAALALYQDLLPDMERVFGLDHLYTLTTRGNIASATGKSGDAAAALAQLREVGNDMERVLGRRHPYTLTTRGNIALWTGQSGESTVALALFQDLLPDMEQVLGPNHLDTLTTRSHIASRTGENGNAAAALALFGELLPDMERVHGPSHPETLHVRNNVAVWTSRCGNEVSAIALCKDLLPDQERVLGPDHPDTLTTRKSLAIRTERYGDTGDALALNRELLPDQERVLGPDHPDTLTTRASIAVLTFQCGDAVAALHLLRRLLLDLERVSGPDHPDTVAARRFIDRLAEETGPAAGS